MPVIQDQEFIDLCNACLDEKIDFAYELLYKQRSLVRYTLETFNSLTEELVGFLKFIIVVCNTNFAVVG